MSLDHQNQSLREDDVDSDLYENQKKEFYDYQINNIYNRDKYVNPHDITGTKGLVKAQNEELDIKKVQFRVNNERYLRNHPELNTMITVFLFKVLEEKPENILSYAGKFFDQEKLKEIIETERKHYIDKKL